MQPSRPCLGTKVLDPATNEASYQWKTYKQIHQLTQALAYNMKEKDFANSVKDTVTGQTLNMIGICSINREEWIVTDLASNLLGITTVPLYETLGEEMLQMILGQTEIETLFGSVVCISNILKLLKAKFDKSNIKLTRVVVFDPITAEMTELLEELGIEGILYKDMVNGEGAEPVSSQSNTIDQIFTISYTSGTSGNSKGVMLSNENFLAAITNILFMASIFKFGPDDVYISYLPLAHVFDRLGVHTMLSEGGSIGFFGGVILKITDDLKLLKPTVFPSVPRLLNKVYDRVLAGVNEKSTFKKFMFHQGLETKRYYNMTYGWTNNRLIDYLVLSQAKERLGGNIRIMITASAPISAEVLRFLRCVFCCPIIEAYGQTESCGASFSTKIYDPSSGHVGAPGIGVEYKLDDLPELDYTRDTHPRPSGEVCIRGPSIFKGYFRNPELTAETIDEHGWLRTGDVGQLSYKNSLKIIDRAKNIFKLSQGEYIVPEKLERAYE